MQSGEHEFFRDLASRLRDAPHGARGKMIREAANFIGVSRTQIYKRLRDAGWRSGRSLRADKGDTRLSDDELLAIANLMVQSSRANGKRLLCIEDAMEIARANGLIRDRTTSPATALRVMRLRGLHPSQIARPTPHTPVRSLHPNHVWQFDVSVCVLFYLDNGGMGVMHEDEFYKNKPDNLKRIANKRVLRYVITDHYSGAFFVKYYLAHGEDQQTLFNFLMDAFIRRDNAKDPFHGVPFQIVWDAGSANQSYLIKNLLDRLSVKHRTHVPGNPRGKGQVEVTHNIIERRFEGRLSMTRVRDIDDLNEKAHVWMRHFNATAKHSRTGTTRYGLWQTIRQDELRIAPERRLCEQLLRTKPEPRKVRGNLTISYRVKGYERADYSLTPLVAAGAEVRVGESVMVCVNPYRAPNIDVLIEGADGQVHTFECPPIKTDLAGFPVDAPVFGESHRAMPDTDIDHHRKTMTKQAYGTDTLDEAQKKRKHKTPVFEGVDAISYLEHQTIADFMPRKGQELPVERPRHETPVLSITAAAKRLVRELDRPVTTDERRQMQDWFPNGVPEDQFNDLKARLLQPDPPAIALVKR